MGLASVTQTALSGLSAATASVDVIANNLANAQTPAFKASDVELATQPGGGVLVSGVAVDFSQGPIDSREQLPLLALEGEGLFILEGDDGERLYTRDGRFASNANGELVNSQGRRLLGFAINENGILDRTQLQPLRMRIGSAAQAADGSTARLIGYSIHRDGRLVGKYTDGVQRTLGQVRLARFHNPQGLDGRGANLYRPTAASGLPLESDPGSGGAGETVAGALELSNVDVGEQLIRLSMARTQYRANLSVLYASTDMLDELLRVARRPR